MRRYAALAVLLVAPGWALADPPKVPEAVAVAVGEDHVLTIEVEADDKFGMAPGFKASDCTFFEGVLRGGKKQFLVRPKKEGSFVVTFWTKGETSYSQTVITTKGATPPIGVPPKDPPGKDPPATPTTGLYFLVVRPDGPAHPEFTAYMASDGWGALQKAGHQVKDKTLSEAGALGVSLPPNTTLPAVVTLRVAPDGKSSTVLSVRPTPAPADIVKLPEGQ